MVKGKNNQVWNRCLTKLDGCPCPWCKKTEHVFTGHGVTRFCSDCIVSWSPGEEYDLLRRMQEGQLEEQTFRQKIATLPQNLRKVANAGVKIIDDSLGIANRLAKLRAITDDEWQKAIDNSPESEDV